MASPNPAGTTIWNSLVGRQDHHRPDALRRSLPPAVQASQERDEAQAVRSRRCIVGNDNGGAVWGHASDRVRTLMSRRPPTMAPSGSRLLTLAYVADFFQNGVIATLHDLGRRSTEDLERELKAWSGETPMSLIIPVPGGRSGRTVPGADSQTTGRRPLP